MAVETAVGGTQVGLDRPLVLVAVPLVAAVLAALLLRAREGVTFARRTRLGLFAARLLVVLLLVVAAAGPYTATTERSVENPRVTMLVDRSSSTAVTADAAGDLAAAIEAEGVAVNRRVVAEGDRSPVGDAVVDSLSANGTVLLVSDGRVTTGRSLSEAAALAGQVNATVSAVNLSTTTTERSVSVSGPAKTSAGVANSFYVAVGGVGLSDPVDVTVEVDGEVVERRAVTGGGFEVRRNFTDTGQHRITARIESEDRFDRNDLARKTVRVVDPPRVLYVARGEYPLEQYLRTLYAVDRAESVPSDLSGYYAVVIQDVAATDLGDTAALQRAVVNGTGLVTVGGRNAFEQGNYRESLLTDVLPVSVGEGGRTTRVVLAVDVSGSTRGSLSVQQALALDALGHLGDGNQVGVVAFNDRPYRVADLVSLSAERQTLADRIRRLQSDGGTDVSAGLTGAAELLGEGGGTVVLLTDGRDDGTDAPTTAARLTQQGIDVVPIGVGRRVDTNYLRQVAQAGDGTYIPADESDRLRIRFGGQTRQYSGDGLTVLDREHFITSGVRFEATPGETNTVAVADRADYLVAGPSGDPAIAAWRYGLGRSVAITTYGSDGTLDGLLTRPDSLAVTKSVNWAIGDPQRLATGVTEVADTRVGDPTTVTYEGDTRPSAADLRFSRVGAGEYRATAVPGEAGYRSVLDAEYAVNYPAEYARFGVAPALRQAVTRTGGTVYEPDQAATIADRVRERAQTLRTVRTDWTWLALVLALVAYVGETCTRRLIRIRT